MTPLTPNEQKITINIARKTLSEFFENRDYKPAPKEKIFSEPRGVFVTLWKPAYRQAGNKKLRGCIGTFETKHSLAQNIHDMALSAAFDDVRFAPLASHELANIDIEISILSPMKKISSIDEIELGTHGVFIKNGKRSGVFLPQVAQNTNWTKEQFLDILCTEKAGLKAGCYLDPKTEIYIFEVQEIDESLDR